MDAATEFFGFGPVLSVVKIFVRLEYINSTRCRSAKFHELYYRTRAVSPDHSSMVLEGPIEAVLVCVCVCVVCVCVCVCVCGWVGVTETQPQF